MTRRSNKTDKMLINQCDLNYLCPKTWGELENTNNPKIRHCPECDRNVHLIESEEDIKSGQLYCIAYLVDTPRMIVGEMGPPSYPKKPEY